MADTPTFTPTPHVLKVRQVFNSQERSTANTSGISETEVYQVETDAIVPLSVARIAIAPNGKAIPAWGAQLPGFPYLAASSIDVLREPNSPKHFQVVVSYTHMTPPPAPSGPDVKWDMDIAVDGVPYSEPIYHDNTGKPILNSARHRFEQTLERTYYDEAIDVSFKSWGIDLDNIAACRGMTNAQPLTMTINGLVRTFAKHTLKLDKAPYRTVYRTTNGQTDPGSRFWSIAYNLQWRKDTWTRKLVDQGFYTLDSTGKAHPVIDPDTQQMVSTPILLDGSGRKLTEGTKAVLLPFEVEDEADFGPLFAGLGQNVPAGEGS